MGSCILCLETSRRLAFFVGVVFESFKDMQVYPILYLFLVISHVDMSFGMPQNLLPGPRDSRVGGSRPSLIPILKRRKVKKERCSKQICPKKLRPAYSAPSFYASPNFLGFQDIQNPASITQNSEFTNEVSQSKRGNVKVPKIRQDKKLTTGTTRITNELNTTFVSQDEVEVLTKQQESNVFQDFIRIKAIERPLQLRKLKPAYPAPSFYASPIFNEVQPLIDLPLDIETKSEAFDTKNKVEKKKQRQEKSDKPIINQEK